MSQNSIVKLMMKQPFSNMVSINIYVCMYVCMYIYIYICIHIYIYIIYIYTHPHTYKKQHKRNEILRSRNRQFFLSVPSRVSEFLDFFFLAVRVLGSNRARLSICPPNQPIDNWPTDRSTGKVHDRTFVVLHGWEQDGYWRRRVISNVIYVWIREWSTNLHIV